ncbi:MAG TPA: response regulator [Planktothrix sp.]
MPRLSEMRREGRLQLDNTNSRLLKTLDEFNKLYHQAPCGYFSLNNDGVIIAINATALDWLGYKTDDVVDRLTFADIATEDSGIKFRRIFPALKENGLAREVDFEIVRKNGSVVPVLFSAISIKLDAKHSMTRCTIFDITERKKAEAALRENQEMTRAIIESANDAFVSIDSDGKITDWNTQAEKIFGWTRSEVLGRGFMETIIPPQSRAAHEADLKDFLTTNGKPSANKRIEISACRKDGHEFPAELASFPVQTANSMKMCAFIHDITDRKHSEEAVRRARDQAIDASKFKSEFLANMSHEIRTPMNGILGMTEMLLRSNLEERQRGFATTIHEAGNSLLAVINDILDFSKIEAGKLTVEIAEFEPVRIVESVAELLAHHARKKKLSLLTYIDPAIPPLMRGDPGRLRQILMNFAGNAIKFSESGEVVIRATVESEENDTVNVLLSVSDSGIGMTDEEMAKLFQPFVQVDGSITRKYGGTGLGLSICKRLVDLLGGTIGVQSIKGEGSTFWLCVPLQKAPNVHNATRLPRDIAKMRVLVVDDEETSREILHEYVSSWGMRGGKAKDAKEALAILKESARSDPHSVALIDLFMTGTNGLELGKAIREDDDLRKMKLILVTAYDNPGAGEDAITQGFNAYLTKPVKQSQLLDCITTVVSETTEDFAARTTSEIPPIPASARLTLPDTAPVRTELLLVVEDHSINQEVALLLLKDLGFEAHVASNGRHALDLMQRCSYSLIFMDCQMPELDGFATTAIVRKSEAHTGKHTPIIAMTAHAIEGSKEQCLSAGMDDYISKPIDPRQLEEMLVKWLPAPVEAPPSNGSTIEVSEQHPSIDLDALSRKYGGKNVDRLIQAFLRDAPRQIEDLQVLIKEQNMPEVMSTAHGLKGISGTVQARAINQTCKDIEEAGRAKNWEDLARLAPKLRKQFDELSVEVKKHFN